MPNMDKSQTLNIGTIARIYRWVFLPSLALFIGVWIAFGQSIMPDTNSVAVPAVAQSPKGSQVRHFKLIIAPPTPYLHMISWNYWPSNGFPVASSFQIDRSSNLVDWIKVGSVPWAANSTNPFTFTDSNNAAAFYRVGSVWP